jgi:hypothetical protein
MKQSPCGSWSFSSSNMTDFSTTPWEQDNTGQAISEAILCPWNFNVPCKLSLQVMWKWEQRLNNHSSCNANCKSVLHDHMLLKTSKQLSVCIFCQSIHETLSSCNLGSWLRGGAVVVTSGSVGIEQGRQMGARRSPGGTLLLWGRKQPGSAELAGNGAAPPLGLAAPPLRGTRRRRLRSTVCKRKKGRERSLVLHLGGGWPELRTASIATLGALRLPAAAKTCRPPSAGGGELKRYKP